MENWYLYFRVLLLICSKAGCQFEMSGFGISMMRAMDSDVEIEDSRQAGNPIPADNSSSSKERFTAGESQMFDKLPRSIQNRRQQQREQPDWIKLLPVVAATVQDQNQSAEKYQPHGANR